MDKISSKIETLEKAAQNYPDDPARAYDIFCEAQRLKRLVEIKGI